MSIRDLFMVMDSMTSESIIAVRDITGKAIFEGELHMFSSKHTALFKNQNITHIRYREDSGIWDIEIW